MDAPEVTRTPRIFALATALLLAVGGSRVVAQPAEGEVRVGVTPTVVQVLASEGAVVSQEITVSNEGERAFAVTSAAVELEGAAEESSAVSWISVEPPRFELEPGATQTLTVEAEVPDGVASGGYFAVVTATTETLSVDGVGAAVAGELGVPFLMTVDGEGEVATEAVVERFAAVLEPDGRTGFRAQVRNAGNTHVVVRGEIEVTAAGGEADDEIAFRESTLILPGKTATLDGPVPVLLERGQTYRATAELDIGSREPLPAETEFTAAAPDLSLGLVTVCSVADQGIAVRFGIENASPIGVLPRATITTRSEDGTVEGEPVVARLPIVWPDDNTPYSIETSGQVDDGAYDLTVTVESGPAARDTGAVSFQVGGDGPDVVEPCD